MPPEPSTSTTTAEGAPTHAELRTAELGRVVRNVFIIGGSLVATWSVALLVRLVLPRQLGPELFGQYRLAEALAMNGFGFVTLGLDTYIQKELPRRPDHASDFYGGVHAVRLLVAGTVLAVLTLIAWARGYSGAVIQTVMLFAAAQLFMVLANTLATMLYAARSVGKLSALNIVAKVVWGLGMALALVQRAALWAYALATAAAEALRLLVVYRLARSTVGFHVRVDAKATRKVLTRSAPFYFNQLAGALYSNIDAAIMGLMVSERELGYYGAATNISNVAMVMAPFFGWVLMPQLSRAAAKREDLVAMMRRSLEWTVTLSLPIALMLGLGADVIMHAVFGEKFEPAIAAMRTLAPMFALVYVAMLGSVCLILMERSWTVTFVTIASVVANAALNLVLLRPALQALGEGGAGIGAAAIWVTTEAAVATTYVVLLRREILDRRNVITFFKSLGACALVFAVHRVSEPLGPVRLGLDALVYSAAVLATRAVRLSELREMLQAAWRSRREASADAPS